MSHRDRNLDDIEKGLKPKITLGEVDATLRPPWITFEEAKGVVKDGSIATLADARLITTPKGSRLLLRWELETERPTMRDLHTEVGLSSGMRLTSWQF